MGKFKPFYGVIPLFTITIVMVIVKNVSAVQHSSNKYVNAPATHKDTVPLTDTVPATDSLHVDAFDQPEDSTSPTAPKDSFSLKISPDALDDVLHYTAEDSVVGVVDSQLVTLYGKATTQYQEMSIDAPEIEINQTKNTVSAKASKDSTGEIADYVKMKQGEEYTLEEAEYNFKTQRGISKGTITQQGEMFVHSEIAKKVDSNTIYGLRSFFTTCNLDHPHFGFRANRSKIINKKLAVTGAVRPEFDSVPVPIYLPFGIFPLYQGRHSGVLSPSIERNDLAGLGLTGLGFYQVVNDYWDVKLYGNIYSYGSWSANVNPTYRKLYKYSGSFNFGLQNTRRNFKGDPDFYSSKTYTLTWSHSSDMRAKPGRSFSANVNLSSTRYNENATNNPYLWTQNVMGSSITYSKTWQDKPFNFTLSANHNQNNSSRLVTINFPNAGFTVNTVYPFQKKESVGTKKWYEQLGIGYQGSFQNAIAFYDTLDTKKYRDGQSFMNYLWDTLQWNASHSIPISLSLPPILGGAIMISPSISYSQQWVDRTTEHRWNGDTVESNINKGLFIKHQTSFGLSLSSALYGTYNSKRRGGKFIAARHVIRPTVGISYTPDLNRKNWEYVQTSDTTWGWFDKLAGLYSRPVDVFNSRKFGGINFGIDNNLEIKVRKKEKKAKDSTSNSFLDALTSTDSDNADSETSSSSSSEEDDGIKKIRIIDGFGFNSSYNLFADSMKLSPLNIYFRTNLFEKINISANANLVPYKYERGQMTRHYAWEGGRFNVGTIQSASVTMSTSFQSKANDPEKQKARENAINQQLNDPMLQADQQRLMEYMRQNPAEFVDFNTPWSINLSYSLNYYKGYNTSTGQSDNGINSSVNFSGSFNLTPKWNFSVNSYYDFRTKKIQTFNMSISRDLHCWQMSINVTPVGLYRFFNFTISPKAGILQDLKINRNRSFYSRQAGSF